MRGSFITRACVVLVVTCFWDGGIRPLSAAPLSLFQRCFVSPARFRIFGVFATPPRELRLLAYAALRPPVVYASSNCSFSRGARMRLVGGFEMIRYGYGGCEDPRSNFLARSTRL